MEIKLSKRPLLRERPHFGSSRNMRKNNRWVLDQNWGTFLVVSTAGDEQAFARGLLTTYRARGSYTWIYAMVA